MTRLRTLLGLSAIAFLILGAWWITSKQAIEVGEARRSMHSPVAAAGMHQQPLPDTAKPTVPEETEAVRRRKPETANSLSRLLPDGRTRGRISKPVIEGFLTRAERAPKALLTAFRESGDRSYLEEAARNFPNEPVVQFAMITDPESRSQRPQWIAAFQKSAPENALADYLAALDAFQRKDGSVAYQELVKASSKPVFDEYLWVIADELETLYLTGGLPLAEAKAMASFSIPLPHLAELQTLGAEIQAAHNSSREAGDEARAHALLGMHFDLGRALSDEPAATLLHRLVGFAIERKAIENAPAAATLAVSGRAGSERLTEIGEIREEILLITRSADITSAPVSDEEVVRYFEMLRSQGELAALQWLKEHTRIR